MHDELDPQLLRRFATAASPLPAEAFTARVSARLAAGRPSGLSSVLGTIAAGLGSGIVATLRIRHLWLMLSGAAAATLWTLI